MRPNDHTADAGHAPAPAGPLVVAVPDGAPDDLGAADRDGRPTTLELAATPALDDLVASGRPRRVTTIPEGLPAGTEVGLAGLLGLTVDEPAARGRLEAAACGEPLEAGEAAWRLDLDPPEAPPADAVAAIGRALAARGARVRALGGHRLLLVGPAAWGDGPPGPHQTGEPLENLVGGPLAEAAEAAACALRRSGVDARVWPWGRVGGAHGSAPAVLGREVDVVAGSPAAAGLAALAGASVHQVPTAALDTGEIAALVREAPSDAMLLVHDGRPDEAAHAGEPPAKVAAVETFDATIVAPVAAALRERGAGSLLVCADHGCDPATRSHTRAPVPAVTWHPAARTSREGEAAPRATERAVAALPAEPVAELVAALAGGSLRTRGALAGATGPRGGGVVAS
ncbi:hypothetical protein [Egibacter rhizosphaerae]|uniref:hypothetical protein n=1 Tax=Egibacter rhizosphaerae TaxID=1670831 RepID=UPI0013F14904|nr:hypothetical protein [Egibacter rhizosphaerae]